MCRGNTVISSQLSWHHALARSRSVVRMAPLWSASETRTLLNAWRDSVDPHTPTQSLYARFVELMDGSTARTEIGVLARRDALKFMWLLITEFHRAEEQSEVQRSWFALPVWEKRAVFGKKTNGRMNSYVEVQHDTFVALDAILSTPKRRRTSPTSRDSAPTLGFIASRAPPVLAIERTAPALGSSSSSSQRNPIVLQGLADDSGSSTESDEDFVSLSAIPSLRRAAASQTSSSSSPTKGDTSMSMSAAPVRSSSPRHKRRKLTLSTLSVEDPAPATQPTGEQLPSESRSSKLEDSTMQDTTASADVPRHALDCSPLLTAREPRPSALSIASLLSSNDSAGVNAAVESEPALQPRAPASPATVSTSEDDDEYDVPATANSSSNHRAMALSQSLQPPPLTDRASYGPVSRNAAMSFITPSQPIKRDPVLKPSGPAATTWLHHDNADAGSTVDVTAFIALIEAQATELQALYRDFQHHKQLEDSAQQTFKALVERDQRDQQHVLRSIRALEARVASETGQWTSTRSFAAPLTQEHDIDDRAL